VPEYSVEIKPSARREFEKLSDSLIARLLPKLEALATEPRPSGCKKLRGYKDLWRIRVGDYRVVYIVNDAGKLVSITRIAHRQEVYE
jgi:mRNA interferase RelE/StbE